VQIFKNRFKNEWKMTGKLKNKIALITGASRGIGAAVAKKYASEGAHVILVARTTSGLEEVDDAIKSAGGEATLVPLDLLDDGADEELAYVLLLRSLLTPLFAPCAPDEKGDDEVDWDVLSEALEPVLLLLLLLCDVCDARDLPLPLRRRPEPKLSLFHAFSSSAFSWLLVPPEEEVDE
jgi:hypothetical protein